MSGVAINVSLKAEEFLKDLADCHPCYGDTIQKVVDDLLTEWEIRDREMKDNLQLEIIHSKATDLLEDLENLYYSDSHQRNELVCIVRCSQDALGTLVGQIEDLR